MVNRRKKRRKARKPKEMLILVRLKSMSRTAATSSTSDRMTQKEARNIFSNQRGPLAESKFESAVFQAS
jgi:hypothetical protein